MEWLMRRFKFYILKKCPCCENNQVLDKGWCWYCECEYELKDYE